MKEEEGYGSNFGRFFLLESRVSGWYEWIFCCFDEGGVWNGHCWGDVIKGLIIAKMGNEREEIKFLKIE